MNKKDQQFLAQKIRTQYVSKQPSELDELRKLDSQAKRPANIFAYAFGSISALIMGAGMSLVMTDIGSTIGIKSAMVPGIFIGVLGITMAIINYPIFKGILKRRKKKYASQILSLSESITNE